MNIIDIGILGILAFGAIIGFKRGFTTQLLSFVGFVVIVVLAFILKNPVSSFLYDHLPFFKFEGVLKGITVLNIALYEVIAFFAIFALLMIIFKLLLWVTKIFEKFLKMTIVLGIPSKILGLIVGVLEYYVVVFILLYITTLPFFNYEIVKESKFRPYILEHTPFLADYTEKPMKVMNEFAKLMDLYKDSSNPDEFNLAALDLFLKYDVIDVDKAVELYENKKLSIGNFYEIICKYEEEYCK